MFFPLGVVDYSRDFKFYFTLDLTPEKFVLFLSKFEGVTLVSSIQSFDKDRVDYLRHSVDLSLS